MSTIDKILKYAKTLVGIKYKYWDPSMKDITDEPMYATNDKVPSLKELKTKTINCAGLINLMRRKAGLQIDGLIEGKPIYLTPGGTYTWFDYLKKEGRLSEFDYKKNYPKGTLLLRKYSSPKEQGHLAIIYNTNKKGQMYANLLHSWTIEGYVKNNKTLPGVDVELTVAQSHFYKNDGYYTHVCLPTNWLIKN